MARRPSRAESAARAIRAARDGFELSATLATKAFTLFTGRAGDVSGSPGGGLLDQLRAIGGASARTASGIDLTAAAAGLGVSRRTVERWVVRERTGAGQRPSARHAAALAQRSRAMATTRGGRASAMAGTGRVASLARGAKLTISGVQGPRSVEYMRPRTVSVMLDPDQAQAMTGAWQGGGQRGLMRWAVGHFRQEYTDGWRFGQVDSLDVDPAAGPRW